MNWRSWLSSRNAQTRTVAGLDVGADVCQLVILSGPKTGPTHVCCVEFLDVPSACRSKGQVLQPTHLGHWLKDYLETKGHGVDALCLGLPDADISDHQVTLANGLSDEDVAFQLAIELADDDAQACIDFQQSPRQEDDVAEPSDDMPYQVRVVPRAKVTSLQQVAKAAKLNLHGVYGRGDAWQCTQTVSTLPTMGVSLALQCEVAFGLALCAWHEKIFNFLPYRAHRMATKRRAWARAVGACVVGGLLSSVGLMWGLSFAAQIKMATLGDSVTVTRAWEEAKQAHANSLQRQQHATQQHQWLAERQSIQRQTLQWAHILNQTTSRVWVSQLTQQGSSWSLQGEALTSEDVHTLVTQLNALDIWLKKPEISQQQGLPTALRAALPVWRFQVNAELKGGTR